MRPFLASIAALLFLLSSQAHAQVKTAAPAAITPPPPSAGAAVTVVELELIKLLALSQGDSRAVFGLPDKQMVTVKTGDPVPRTRAKLTQVMTDKVALEETSADGKTRQLVWMHKGQGATPGRIERFATQVAPTLVAPAPIVHITKITREAAANSTSSSRKP